MLQVVLIESIERFGSLTEWVRNVFSQQIENQREHLVLRASDPQTFRYVSEVRPHVLTRFIHWLV